MIKAFYGDNRIAAKKAIEKFLGKDYEVIDCAELTPGDLPTIFLGNSLFTTIRSILLRDFTTNKAVYEHLPDYLNTPHKIALFELKLDKRSSVYKNLKDKISFAEFAMPKDQNFGVVFSIYRTAKQNGKRAVEMLKAIEPTEDPIMFFGLLASQAIKDFEATSGKGIKEKRVLKALAETDLRIKTAKVEPWLLVESFLIRLSSL